MNEKKIPAIRFQGFTDEWEHHKFGDIAKFINGRAYTQNELLPTGKYKVLRVGNFYTNESWYYSNLELAEKYYAEDGDLLYTWSATFGPHIWHGEKVIYHYHIWKVDVSDRLDKYFAMQLFEQDKHDILSGYNGSTMAHITKYGMEKKRVIIPPNIEEQKQLGIFLGKLDQLIALHQHKLTKLQLLKKSMLTKMFPKDGARVPEIRFQGFHKNWENLLFDDAVNISNDMVDPKAGSFDKLIHIGPGDIESHTGQLLPGIKTVSESHLISGKFRFYKGDIIYSKIRPELSKCVIAPTDGLASADAYILHCNKEMWQDFLYCILQTKHFYKYATSISMRTGMPKINREELGRYFFLAPSVKEQQLIGAFFTDLDHLISLHQRKLSKLQQIKQAMLSKLFV